MTPERPSAIVAPVTGADPIEHHLHETLERLTDEFAGMHGSETVVRYASEVALQFADAPVIDFVPVLVYRFTRERLLAEQPGRP